MTREIEISELSISWIAVHDKCYITCFYSRERYAPATTFTLFIFIICFLYFVFDNYILWLLGSNKTWLSERFSFLSRHKLLLLEYFLFYFKDYISSYYYHFWFSLSLLLLLLFHIYFSLLFLLLLLSYCFYVLMRLTFSFKFCSLYFISLYKSNIF